MLPKLLESLAAQNCGWDSGHVFLVANNCTDDTVAVANGWAYKLPLTVLDVTFAPAQAHVGTARKLALDTGCEWLGDADADAALLTTDADAILPPDWIVQNLAALATSDLVGGRLVADLEMSDAGIERLQHQIALYWEGVRGIEEAIDPQDQDSAPRHGDHTGGSLAFRAALYRRVGGLPPLASGEDAAFVAGALRSGARLRHCPKVHVRVSGRAIGRAAGGMAVDMARRQAVAGGTGAYLLPHPTFWVARIQARHRLRQAWRHGADVARALATEGLSAQAIVDVLESCPNDIAFVERASEHLSLPEPATIDVDEAVALLGRFERQANEHRRVA